MKKSTAKTLGAALLVSAGLAGCAASPPPVPDPNPELMRRIERAERAAADAQAAAARAQARADEAAAMAQQNVDKIDRAFKKSQQK